MTAQAMPDGAVPALKEWAAAITALLAGPQTVLLRKGGIGEKRFTLGPHGAGGSRFLLYPTVAHSHAESTRPQHHDLLASGARDVRLGPDGAPTSVTIRAVAEVVAAVAVDRPENIAALEPFHVWTTASVRQNRLDFRPRHRLAAIVLQVRPLTAPIELAVLDGYGGCRSWIDLDPGATVPDPGAVPPTAHPSVDDISCGAPVVGPGELDRIAQEVRRTVG